MGTRVRVAEVGGGGVLGHTAPFPKESVPRRHMAGDGRRVSSGSRVQPDLFDKLVRLHNVVNKMHDNPSLSSETRIGSMDNSHRVRFVHPQTKNPSGYCNIVQHC